MRGNPILHQSPPERRHRRVTVRLEQELGPTRIIRRDDRQPTRIAERDLHLLHEAEDLRIEPERTVMVVHEHARHVHSHRAPLTFARAIARLCSSAATYRDNGTCIAPPASTRRARPTRARRDAAISPAATYQDRASSRAGRTARTVSPSLPCSSSSMARRAGAARASNTSLMTNAYASGDLPVKEGPSQSRRGRRGVGGLSAPCVANIFVAARGRARTLPAPALHAKHRTHLG